VYELKSEAKGLVAHGISTCHGCGLELAMRTVLGALGERTILVIPPGCAAMFSGYGKETAVKVAGIQGCLENTAAIAAGIRAGLEVQGIEDVNVVAFAGDGGTVDIGLQSLSGALERGDRIIYICSDNEAYMNTGIQGSGSTPYGARTTTTPAGKRNFRKDMLAIAVAHRIPYVASASAFYPEDLRRKVLKARDCGGPAYIHMFMPCPTGWGYPSEKSVEISELAVKTRIWPLYEVVNGKYRLTVTVNDPVPVERYLRMQRRFRSLTDEDIAAIQAFVDAEYEKLLERVNH